ncbi:amino acid deaminase [Nocardioides hungaricus]
MVRPDRRPGYRRPLDAPRGEDLVTWRDRGFPEGKVSLAEVGEQGWNLLEGDFHFPVAALKERALERNLHLMSAYCEAHDVLIAPHAKTSMSPDLVARQVDAGAWGVTVANVQQVRVFIHAGIRRLLIANPLVGRADLTFVAEQLRVNPDMEILALADSVDAVERVAAAWRREEPGTPPLQVLLEVSYVGGRAGVRTTEDAIRVAEAVRRSDHLDLVGVGGFEGLVPGRDLNEKRRRARDFLDWAGTVVQTLHDKNLFAAATPLVSFGGSSFFDLVVARFRDQWRDPRVAVLLRSGCYLTHDHGIYAQTSPFVGQSPEPLAALEVWAEVLSRPEAGLVIVGAGRRDVSTDAGLPIPIAVRSAGQQRAATGLQVSAVNDQHAFVSVPTDDPISVGDLVCFGISHPCTTFDKWRLLPVVTDDYEVVHAVRTYF